jgi:hypothetical protein
MIETIKKDPATRNREWRARRRQDPGGLTQIITWVPRDYAEPLRKIFQLLGDPDWRGRAYRDAVAFWLYRRRPAPARIIGDAYTIEIDNPRIDNGRETIPIGGRVFGPDGTLVELTPDEAGVLSSELRRITDETAQKFLSSRNLDHTLRDFTGVLPAEVAPHHAGYRPPNLTRYDVDRPESDEQFQARDAAVVAEITAIPARVEVATVVAPKLYELSYAGSAGVPSRCLAYIGEPGELDRTNNSWLIALIGLPQDGTPPTLVFDRLADTVRKTLVTAGEARLRFFDIEPDQFSPAAGLRIAEVKPGSDDPNALTWEPNPQLSIGFNRSLREALQTYGNWRRRPRLTLEEAEAVASFDDREGSKSK